jgi:hypothetical protein
MNDPNIRGCNLGDLQLLLDILEGEWTVLNTTEQ